MSIKILALTVMLALYAAPSHGAGEASEEGNLPEPGNNFKMTASVCDTPTVRTWGLV